MLLKFVGCDKEGSFYEVHGLKTDEDMKRLDKAVKEVVDDEAFYEKGEEAIVMEALSRAGLTGERVGVLTIMM